MKELICCTALTRIVYGDGHWKLANAYAKLAEGYCDLKSKRITFCVRDSHARIMQVLCGFSIFNIYI